MSLPIITIDEIKSHRSSEEEEHIVVLAGNDGCAGCAEYEPRIEELAADYPGLSFYRLILDPEDYPVFAPPVIPFVVGMTDGQRMWEGLGVLKDLAPLKSIINEWADHNITLAPSGSTYTKVE